MVVFGVIVLLILLVIGDRVALAVAENDMADQFVSNGFPVKPSVTIEGFPFLTQLVARDLRKVDISASNIPAGPVTITNATGTLNGLHFNSSFNSATVDHVTVRIFVSFAALAGAGGLGNVANLTITPAGPNLLKITGSLGGVLSDTEEAKITTCWLATMTTAASPSSNTSTAEKSMPLRRAALSTASWIAGLVDWLGSTQRCLASSGQRTDSPVASGWSLAQIPTTGSVRMGRWLTPSSAQVP